MTKKIILCSALWAAVLSSTVAAQSPASRRGSAEAENEVTEEILRQDVEFYASEQCGGRSVGSEGSSLAAELVCRRFREAGLKPFGNDFRHGFELDGVKGTNIIGMIPAFGAASADKYIVVAAHYDNLAPSSAHYYPGADSNASGVAALTAVARMFRHMSDAGKFYPQNIIFIALDAKQESMAGAYGFWRDLVVEEYSDPLSGKGVKAANITLFVNLDILGGVQAPVNKDREDYLIMLGGSPARQKLLFEMNDEYGTGLDLSLDYYGSKGFTDMFLNRVSEQRPFIEHGIQGVMFTSGITMDTNKESDTADKVRPDVLRRRAILIFHWLEKAIYSN